jgi:hypothetical protein
VAVTLGEIMLASPEVDFFDGSIRTPIAVAAPPISFLEESLIVALELGVQNDTLDAGATLLEPLRDLKVCAVDLGVVRELTRLLQPTVELLSRLGGIWLRGAAPIRFEQLATAVGQHHIRAIPTRCGNCAHEPLLAETSQVTGPRIDRAVLAVPKIAGGQDAERADGRQRARLGPSQCVFAIANVNTPAIGSARQADVAHEYVTRIAFFCFPWIGRGTTNAAAHIPARLVFTSLVRPTRIDLVHTNLRLR